MAAAPDSPRQQAKPKGGSSNSTLPPASINLPPLPIPNGRTPLVLFVIVDVEGLAKVRANEEKECAEMWDIQQKERFKLGYAADLVQLEMEINKFRPDIVHFAGHGTLDGVRLRNGEAVTEEAMRTLFSRHQPVLLFLNSCNSALLAKKLADVIPLCIGWPAEVGDSKCVQAALSYYRTVFAVKDFTQAFNGVHLDPRPLVYVTPSPRLLKAFDAAHCGMTYLLRSLDLASRIDDFLTHEVTLASVLDIDLTATFGIPLGQAVQIKNAASLLLPATGGVLTADPYKEAGGIDRGKKATLYCGNNPESWIRADAELDRDTGRLTVSLQLETDHMLAGPKGKAEVTGRGERGEVIWTRTTAEFGIGGKGMGHAAIHEFVWHCNLEPHEARRTRSMFVQPLHTGTKGEVVPPVPDNCVIS